MGNLLFDQYTLLHFAIGVMFYFWGFSFLSLFVIHTIFELLENTEYGIFVINKYISFWPGGKLKADSIINRIGDTIGAIFGWYSSKVLDNYYNTN